MITLKEAIKLTKLSENDICFLKNEGAGYYDAIVLTVKEVKNKYDLKNTMVMGITPKFGSGDYRGIEFEITQ